MPEADMVAELRAELQAARDAHMEIVREKLAEIEALKAHVRRLKEALEPISTAWDYAGALFDRPVTASVLCTVARSCIEAGHFRTARTAVAMMEDGKHV